MNDMFLFLTSASFVNDITTYRSNTDIIINAGKAAFSFCNVYSTSSTVFTCLFLFPSSDHLIYM